jgi:hypothetical protein
LGGTAGATERTAKHTDEDLEKIADAMAYAVKKAL